jgi:exosortase
MTDATQRGMIGQRRSAQVDWMAVVWRYWFVALAAAALAGPSLVKLGKIVWTTEQGAQGPIILATGLWLLWNEVAASQVAARPPALARVLLAMTPSILIYLVGRIAGILTLEWLGVSLMLIAALYAYVGGRKIRSLWFPLLYLMFLTPPPYSVLAATTRVLKLGISASAVNVMDALGYQVASSGTTIYIDQYELLVAEACSGMNSIISLLAIGLFYIFLRHRADWRYAAMLAVLVLPIAILTNLVRVIILMLMTHYLGDAVAQGMLHEAAGLMMFFIALFTLMGVDQLLSPLRRYLGRRAAA